MKKRISSADPYYKPGYLSVFPNGIDSFLTLYKASNNAATKTKHSITPVSKYITVDDHSKFPSSGILRITHPSGNGNAEVVHYGKKTSNQFHDLKRGFAGHGIYSWPAGSFVTYPVMAEHHNALKDAILKLQKKIGIKGTDDPETITSIVKAMEDKWLKPKASFRAFPKAGTSPLKVKFQNTSGGDGLKFLWDFGDGTFSTDKSPLHTYYKEGKYNVKLSMISSLGSQGMVEKAEYITVSDEEQLPFFYTKQTQGYSVETANSIGIDPTEFVLIDQTDGNITERNWFFDDGVELTENNPNIHVAKHIYNKPGTYKPSMLIRFDKEKILLATINEDIVVI